MKEKIGEGKIPGILISARSWNDESSGTIIDMEVSKEVCYTLGQQQLMVTLCV